MKISEISVRAGVPEWKAYGGITYANILTARDACNEAAAAFEEAARVLYERNGVDDMKAVGFRYRAATEELLTTVMALEFVGIQTCDKLGVTEHQNTSK